MTTNSPCVCEKTAASVAQAPAKIERPVYEPAADALEKPDAIHILLDMPGVDQKGLNVTIENHVLNVRGRSAVTETKPGSVLLREFEAADYERSFRLGADIDEGRITAHLKNGLLNMTIPKRPETKPACRHIEITM